VSTNWGDSAACADVDPELFFPVHQGRPGGTENNVQVRVAKWVCKTCTVQAECLEWALEHEAFGIWGGTTDLERRKLRQGAAS
jgi:WhiB family redox-sensing transcriptional regulator